MEERGGCQGARGGRGRRGSGRGDAGGGSGQGREVQVSKALSKLLRHHAEKEGLQLDDGGFARLDQVMQWPRLKSLHVTFDDIKTVVVDNAKQRFSMKPSPSLSTPDLSSTNAADWIIRANQGHSIAIDASSLLTPVTLDTLPETVIHGTYFAFWEAIVESGGLKRMTRNHIHFSTGLPEGKEDIISGMRKDAEILIYVDIKRSLEEGGVKWWKSENGVVLTDGNVEGMLSSKYFTRVEGRREEVGILWEDGKEVAKLPEKQRGRKPPRGKEVRGDGHRGGAGRGNGRRRGRDRGRGKQLDGEVRQGET
ncbi:KptA family-domain-containing protein [Calycina marina]|uniref:2'-phosphotransferase n=1 Tax=Calycina marina TaxID=1763456 RepID=A0A9P8CF74_9HELO|nr:KptA family-domain-containing protein [Calycina marina]